MKNVFKGILSVLVGLILWAVCVLVLIAIPVLLVVYVEPVGNAILDVISWIERSDSFGHLVPTFVIGLPCLLPAWVIYKLCSGSRRTIIVSEIVTAVIGFGVLAYSTIFGEMPGWWLLQGAIGIFTAFGIFVGFAKDNG